MLSIVATNRENLACVNRGKKFNQIERISDHTWAARRGLARIHQRTELFERRRASLDYLKRAVDVHQPLCDASPRALRRARQFRNVAHYIANKNSESLLIRSFGFELGQLHRGRRTLYRNRVKNRLR